MLKAQEIIILGAGLRARNVLIIIVLDATFFDFFVISCEECRFLVILQQLECLGFQL